MMLLRSVLCVVLVASAWAQFFDLDQDEDTKFRGTTQEVLPNCFAAPTGMCGEGGRAVVTPDARHRNLVAWYSFDDALGLDSSGNANHALAPPPDVGPGHDGLGQSAHFSGADFFKIPHSEKFDSLHQMTVSFWIYLLTDSSEAWRVIFRKGEGGEDFLTPSLMLFPDSRRVHAVVSTTDKRKRGLDSITQIPLRRWTHVALALNYNVMEIFINGIKDNEGMLTGEVMLNSLPFYVGKEPGRPGAGMYIDNFKIHSHAMDESEIQIEASAALPGLGPNFVRLGCKSCEMRQAIEQCASTGGYHLCRRMELNGGALMVARAMGYLELSSENWAAEDEEPEVQLEKLGLCCMD